MQIKLINNDYDYEYDYPVHICWFQKKQSFNITVGTFCFLFFTAPPIITIESKFFVGREQTASLYCDVEGNPTPWIHWTPCDLPSIGCHKQYLNISKVQTSRATYTCTASNYLGSDSETTLLSKLQSCNKWIFNFWQSIISLILGL